MQTQLLALLLWLAPTQAPGYHGAISGVAVNGTHNESPLANAVVVLRADFDGGFTPVEQTRTDSAGRFIFEQLPTGDDVTYLPGVSFQDVHYPGPRLQLTEDRPDAFVRVVAYDAIESPDPMVCRRAQFEIRPGDGFLEITETLTIANPMNVSYVGEPLDDRPAVTLRLALPAGFDTITFDKEFNGRNFLLHDNQLLSDLPWPPGEREIRFQYRLPATTGHLAIRRETDLPTDHVVVRVLGKTSDEVMCSLPAAAQQQDGAIIFEHSGSSLPAGHAIELEIGALPITVDVYARWGALALLAVLVAAALVVAWRRRGTSTDIEDDDDKGVTPRMSPHRADVIPFEGATPKNMPSPAEKRRRRRRRAA